MDFVTSTHRLRTSRPSCMSFLHFRWSRHVNGIGLCDWSFLSWAVVEVTLNNYHLNCSLDESAVIWLVITILWDLGLWLYMQWKSCWIIEWVNIPPLFSMRHFWQFHYPLDTKETCSLLCVVRCACDRCSVTCSCIRRHFLRSAVYAIYTICASIR